MARRKQRKKPIVNECECARKTVQALQRLYRQAPFARPGELRKIGIEDEWPFVSADGSMGHCQPMIDYLIRHESGWTPHFDEMWRDVLIGARHDQYGELKMEAGCGTLEWASPPSSNLHRLAELRREIVNLLVATAERFRLFMLGTGRQPCTRGCKATAVLKYRYEFFYRRFGRAFDLLHEINSQQVQVECRDPEEMVLLTNDLLMLTGFLTALAANSPIYWNKVGTLAASRVSAWDEYAPGRVGIPDRPYIDLRDLCQEMWKAEYIFGPDDKRDGYRLYGRPFGEVVSRQPMPKRLFRQHAFCHEGCRWEDTRPRACHGTIENRCDCQQPQWMGVSLPALILGLVENHIGRRSLLNLYDWRTWKRTRWTAAEFHFLAPIGNQHLGDLLPDLLDIAKIGLQIRGQGEEDLLEPVRQLIEERKHPPAVDQILAFQNGGIKELIERFAYRLTT